MAVDALSIHPLRGLPCSAASAGYYCGSLCRSMRSTGPVVGPVSVPTAMVGLSQAVSRKEEVSEAWWGAIPCAEVPYRRPIVKLVAGASPE